MSFNVAMFKNAPATYLGQKSLVNPGNKADTVTNTEITGRGTWPGVDMEVISISNQLSRRAFYLMPTPNGYQLSFQDPDAGFFGGLASLVGKGQAAGSFQAFWLPWDNGKAFKMQLTGGPDLFITAKMNSCGFIVGGTRTQPVVIHANYDGVTQPKFNGDLEDYNRRAREAQIPEYQQAYGGLAAKAISMGVFGPGNPNVAVLDPEFYLTESLQFASVFGIRSGANWTFYATITDIQGIAGTIEVWPNQPTEML